MFKNFPKDKIKLQKGDGEIINNISAIITKDSIVIDNPNLPIEVGDILIRTLPSKLEEKYEIIDYTFYPKMGGIPAHFQIKYERYKNKKIEEKSNNVSKSEIYHIHNSNVIIGSENSSINVENNNELFETMLKVINASVIDNKIEIITAINNMKENANTPLFNDKYKEFIGVSANVMAIVSPYISALTSLLK